MDNQKSEWEHSYRNKDNFVFYPHEEVIRFISKYVRKKVGVREFQDIKSFPHQPKVLDLGCGIGRHVIYTSQMQMDAYGVDLSEEAVSFARDWAAKESVIDPESKIVQADIRKLPWGDGYFQYILSHGVLDSMRYESARGAVKEAARVLEKDGLFYCDLVSGDCSTHYREYAGEEIVRTKHEEGTIQSYFNFNKIQQLIKDKFEIVEAVLIKRENVMAGGYISRYHLVLRRL